MWDSLQNGCLVCRRLDANSVESSPLRNWIRESAKSILTSLKLTGKHFPSRKARWHHATLKYQHTDNGACRKAASQTFPLHSFSDGALSLVPCWCLICDHKYQRKGLAKGKKCTLSGDTSSSLIVGSARRRDEHRRSIYKIRSNYKLWYISLLCSVLHIVSRVGGNFYWNSGTCVA